MLCYIYHKLKDYKIDTNGTKDYINIIILKKLIYYQIIFYITIIVQLILCF